MRVLIEGDSFALPHIQYVLSGLPDIFVTCNALAGSSNAQTLHRLKKNTGILDVNPSLIVVFQCQPFKDYKSTLAMYQTSYGDNLGKCVLREGLDYAEDIIESKLRAYYASLCEIQLKHYPNCKLILIGGGSKVDQKLFLEVKKSYPEAQVDVLILSVLEYLFDIWNLNDDKKNKFVHHPEFFISDWYHFVNEHCDTKLYECLSEHQDLRNKLQEKLDLILLPDQAHMQTNAQNSICEKIIKYMVDNMNYTQMGDTKSLKSTLTWSSS
jgi:hypothetical protein